MLWCIGGVNGNIGNIVASEGLDAFEESRGRFY